MPRRSRRSPDKPEVICKCNEIRKDVIEAAIVAGSSTLNEIFDATTAGVGPCGGTCRTKLAKMLDQYQKTGTFPATFIGVRKKR